MKHLLRLLAITAAFALATASHAADLTVTAASVIPGPNADTITGVAGVTITAGQIVYLESSSNTWKLADADASAATSGSGGAIGLAAGGASTGQQFVVVLSDDNLTVGGTLLMTAPIYVLSGTAGGIAPIADLAAADYPVVLLIARSTTKAVFKPVRGPAVVTAS
jgi:hypothetical protein